MSLTLERHAAMSEHSKSVKYRCAKCHHRLTGQEPICPHCHWKVVLPLAVEAAQIFLHKRNEYYNKRKRSKALQFALLAVMAVGVVLTILILINSFDH